MDMPYFADSPSNHNLLDFPLIDFENGPHNADGWTDQENKVFEDALANFHPIGTPAFFEHVGLMLPWKSFESIQLHYQALVDDIAIIESDDTEFPDDHEVDIEMILNDGYQIPVDDNEKEEGTKVQDQIKSTQNEKGLSSSSSSSKLKGSTAGKKNIRGTPWTDYEHRLFLMGLHKYGKGDWRNIARNLVITKTPTQVASHAQKFFRRMNTPTPAEKRRPSIHDIQSVDSTCNLYPARHRNPLNINLIPNFLHPPQPNTENLFPDFLPPTGNLVSNLLPPNPSNTGNLAPNFLPTNEVAASPSTYNNDYCNDYNQGAPFFQPGNSIYQVGNNSTMGQAWVNQQGQM